ncbi:hypothetical protein P154DRAFT_359486 [Amniculicola lignicola CBS 123094]|uniref:Uncharacterized protein n=1 Tax=Amniculicola lignicola CBS 123094 TaxID=1392246 RepID=A0A6A5WBS2_9PLEO|nr:hypothetical protein P154DRAFT_359486 [Amniculicola lignicola CBS 123094]
MSNPQKSTYSYSTSATFSSFSSSTNGSQRSYSQATHTDPSGTRVYRSSQEPGQQRREERLQYDAQGKRIEGGGEKGRIEDVTDREGDEGDEGRERDAGRKYEERMKEEYAKREGGA